MLQTVIMSQPAERRARARVPERHVHREPWVCPRCGTAQHEGAWSHVEVPVDPAQVRCPVCHRPEDDASAAPMHMQGPFERS
jgi:hypothetical protein